MSAGDQLNQRLLTALDRLAWGCSDLRRLLAERGWWPARSWHLLSAAGQRYTLVVTRLCPGDARRTPQGWLVPRGECLWGQLSLPDMPRKDLRQAVDEALWRLSPLPPEQMLCAWHSVAQPAGGWRIEWGVCRREAQDSALAAAGLPAQAPVFLDDGNGLALPAQSSQAPPPDARRMQWAAALLMLLMLVALCVPAFLPLALKRQAVTRAMAHVTALEPQAAPLRQQLDELRQQADLAEGLRAASRAQLPLASIVELLSATVPDGAWLERIELNGSTIRIVGVADNAGELLALLTRQPRLADVHATAASVRDNTLGKERYTAEMRWRDAPAPEAKP